MKKPKKLKRLDLLKGCELTIENKMHKDQAQRIANGKGWCTWVNCSKSKVCMFQLDESVGVAGKSLINDCLICTSNIAKYVPKKYRCVSYADTVLKLIHAMGYRSLNYNE